MRYLPPRQAADACQVRKLLTWEAAALGVAVLALIGHVATGPYDPTGGIIREGTYHGLLIGSALACFLRVWRRPQARLAWSLVGASILFWAAADVYGTLVLLKMDAAPYPSIADAGWVSMYPLMYIAVLLMLRETLKKVPGTTWLDGLVGALTFSALGIALVFTPILAAATVGTASQIMTNLAYPVGDLLLLAVVVFVYSVHGWRPGRRWAFFAAALAVSAVGDGLYLYQTSIGPYDPNGLTTSLWPLATVLFAVAAWQPQNSARPATHDGWPAIAMPAAFTFLAIAVLVYDHFERLSSIVVMLAAGALVVVALRTGLTFRDYLRVLATSRGEAKTDALTGLSNRRALMNELTRRLTLEPEQPFGLALFDLDGFKAYNDAFGHIAGDDLLHRLAERLLDALPPGASAYRLGGDEFCVLTAVGAEPIAGAIGDLRSALSETGHGFSVTSSVGTVSIPDESREERVILTLADRRMYQDKSRKRASAGSQTRAALLSLLRERQPDLDEHMQEVAGLARRLGRELALDGEALDEVVRAAELHDIGKLALPDSILNSPNPLTESEWNFMRNHTLIGERILSSAPALLPVAQIVRSSHERWDGGGYPDKLAGDQISVGARIVFLCDTYHAITVERPYAEARSHEEAVAEIERCAGTQFDPDVVAAFLRIAGGLDDPDPRTGLAVAGAPA
jgi:diguanylate cyclase (GGDEF)-like protein